MEQTKYWQSFGELNKLNANQSTAEDEFQEDLPFEADDKGFLEIKTPRRDFLKFVGFSTAAAAAAATSNRASRTANIASFVLSRARNTSAGSAQDPDFPALRKVCSVRSLRCEAG